MSRSTTVLVLELSEPIDVDRYVLAFTITAVPSTFTGVNRHLYAQSIGVMTEETEKVWLDERDKRTERKS